MSESVDEGAIRWVKGREGVSGQSGVLKEQCDNNVGRGRRCSTYLSLDAQLADRSCIAVECRKSQWHAQVCLK